MAGDRAHWSGCHDGRVVGGQQGVHSGYPHKLFQPTGGLFFLPAPQRPQDLDGHRLADWAGIGIVPGEWSTSGGLLWGTSLSLITMLTLAHGICPSHRILAARLLFHVCQSVAPCIVSSDDHTRPGMLASLVQSWQAACFKRWFSVHSPPRIALDSFFFFLLLPGNN